MLVRGEACLDRRVAIDSTGIVATIVIATNNNDGPDRRQCPDGGVAFPVRLLAASIHWVTSCRRTQLPVACRRVSATLRGNRRRDRHAGLIRQCADVGVFAGDRNGRTGTFHPV